LTLISETVPRDEFSLESFDAPGSLIPGGSWFRISNGRLALDEQTRIKKNSGRVRQSDTSIQKKSAALPTSKEGI
jgi:hypothetical protein